VLQSTIFEASLHHGLPDQHTTQQRRTDARSWFRHLAGIIVSSYQINVARNVDGTHTQNLTLKRHFYQISTCYVTPIDLLNTSGKEKIFLNICIKKLARPFLFICLTIFCLFRQRDFLFILDLQCIFSRVLIEILMLGIFFLKVIFDSLFVKTK